MGEGNDIVLTFEDDDSDDEFVFSRLTFSEKGGEKELIRALTEDEILFIKPMTDKYIAALKAENP